MNENDDVRSNVGCQNGGGSDGRGHHRALQLRRRVARDQDHGPGALLQQPDQPGVPELRAGRGGYVDVWTDTPDATDLLLRLGARQPRPRTRPPCCRSDLRPQPKVTLSEPAQRASRRVFRGSCVAMRAGGPRRPGRASSRASGAAASRGISRGGQVEPRSRRGSMLRGSFDSLRPAGLRSLRMTGKLASHTVRCRALRPSEVD